MPGCGAVGDPMPPLLDIPQAATALTAIQRGDRLLIAWPAPARTTEGVAPRPGRLGPIKIYRAVFSDLQTKASEAALKDAKEIQQLAPGETSFTDPVDRDWVHHLVVYAVKLTNRRGEAAGFSNVAAVQVQAVLPPPEIRAEVTEPAVVILWSPLNDTKYRVYRDGGPVGDIVGGRFLDPNFEFGRTYNYLVRALSGDTPNTAESVDSNVVAVTPVDKFPPAIPQGLRAVVTEGVAEISWSPNREADLAGYNLYRNGAKVNDKTLVNTVFRDPTPGVSPRYTVTSVDTHGNESKTSEEVVP